MDSQEGHPLQVRPLEETFAIPPVPAVVQVDTLDIKRVDLYCWCSLALANVRFLPEALKVVVRLEGETEREQVRGVIDVGC